MINVSPQLLVYARKVLQVGAGELIEAAALAGLPVEEQAARKVRELRGGRSASGAVVSRGPFGLVSARESSGPDGVVLLLGPAAGLAQAIESLKAGGVHYERFCSGPLWRRPGDRHRLFS